MLILNWGSHRLHSQTKVEEDERNLPALLPGYGDVHGLCYRAGWCAYAALLAEHQAAAILCSNACSCTWTHLIMLSKYMMNIITS